MKRMQATHEEFKAMYWCMVAVGADTEMERTHARHELNGRDFATAKRKLEATLDRPSWSEYYRKLKEAQELQALRDAERLDGSQQA